MGNSIAALFAQQSPSPEISYAAVVAEQLRSYTRPIIDFTMHQFELECCHRLYGDLSFAKAAANKALDNLDKIHLLNDHYQLMWDFNVWDIFNPPSLKELKLLSTRHPYQPISALLRKDVDNCKLLISSQIESIIQYRHVNTKQKEDSQGEGCSSRYAYPPSDKYSRLENNIVFNVVNGRQCEPSLARNFKISINELIAFLINSEAKFTKVYKEGTSKCFLMPAEFRDSTMRDFFRVKFEQFADSSGSIIMNDDDYRGNISSDLSSTAPENADFAEEHMERRKAELQYDRSTDSEADDQEGPDKQIESSSRENLPPVTIEFSKLKKDNRRISSPSFNQEVERAQKCAIDPREVCLEDWEVRDKAQEMLEKLCACIQEIVNKNNFGCEYEETKTQASKSLFKEVDLFLGLLRKTNEESESARRVSQILESTLFALEDIVERFIEPNCLDNCLEMDKQFIRDRVEAHQKFYQTLGTHSTSLFYEKNQIYQNLKSRMYKVCCVCGTKNPVTNQSSELKNAVAYKELLVVEDEELAAWKSLKYDDEDELGAVAQQCFHIASVEVDKKYYHILDIDNPNPDNAMEKSCCLIKDGKLLRLPACNECFDRLKKADKFLKENLGKSTDGGISE